MSEGGGLCSLRLRILFLFIAFSLQFYAWGSIAHNDFSFCCTGGCSVETQNFMHVSFEDSVPTVRKGGSASQSIKLSSQFICVRFIYALQGGLCGSRIFSFFLHRVNASYLPDALPGLFGCRDRLSDLCVLRI